MVAFRHVLLPTARPLLQLPLARFQKSCSGDIWGKRALGSLLRRDVLYSHNMQISLLSPRLELEERKPILGSSGGWKPSFSKAARHAGGPGNPSRTGSRSSGSRGHSCGAMNRPGRRGNQCFDTLVSGWYLLGQTRGMPFGGTIGTSRS